MPSRYGFPRLRRGRPCATAVLLGLLLAPVPARAQDLERGAALPPRQEAGGGGSEDLRRAEAEFEAGHYVEAAILYERHLQTHPADGDARVRLGWSHYRAGNPAEARRIFEGCLLRNPASGDARVGLGYSLLQAVGPSEAAVEFRKVLRADPENQDALQGMMLAGRREGAGPRLLEEAVAAAKRLSALSPGDREAGAAVTILQAAREGAAEKRLRPAAGGALPLRIAARSVADLLEVRDGAGGWQPIFVKGVNLGLALPGRFPTEFPTDEATYHWFLEIIAGLGANTVRAYTLLPPAFYKALAEHNARPGAARLWLIQGVWTELPPGHDYSNEEYLEEFQAEIARVVDAVHGNLLLAPRPGHASGLYETDASDSLLAWIIGREWEPFAVKDYNALRPGETAWQGKWFTTSGGRAMECWVARILDHAVGYEAAGYRAIRPTAFSNWPTLDPLAHPTDATRAEEDAWRRRYGLETHLLAGAAWEDDAVALDATLIRPTEAMRAGTFASYHIYPNYPDFLNLEPDYAFSADGEGPSRYVGYLRQLKAYHGRQPVLVAEFGISTSRGVAHLQPDGWHHGGHDELRQGELVARMLRQIHETGLAGGIIFEFMDEWFKSTWSAAPFEIPAERRRLWFNAESPEQSYGLLAARPGPVGGGICLDGDPWEWTALPSVAAGSAPARPAGPSAAAASGQGGAERTAPSPERERGRKVRAARRNGGGWKSLRQAQASWDEGYLYLLLRTEGGPQPPDWSKVAFRVALDTYDAARGERLLPPPGAAEVPTGVEFLVDVAGPGRSAVTVSAPYESYSHLERGPFASPEAPSGSFVRLMMATNRERFGRDGTRYPEQAMERGRLRFGRACLPERAVAAEAADFDSRADVAVDPRHGTIEMRLPWALLNVTDPSSRRVLHQTGVHAGPYDTVETEGFRIYVFASDPSRPGRDPASRLPAEGEVPRAWLWEAWETPRYHLELKKGAAAIRGVMQRLTEEARVESAAAREVKDAQ